MFGIGFVEIAIILVVALVAIGPEKLPDLMKSIGKTFGEFKRAAEDVKKSMDEVEEDFSESVSMEEKDKDKDKGKDDDDWRKRPS